MTNESPTQTDYSQPQEPEVSKQHPRFNLIIAIMTGIILGVCIMVGASELTKSPTEPPTETTETAEVTPADNSRSTPSVNLGTEEETNELVALICFTYDKGFSADNIARSVSEMRPELSHADAERIVDIAIEKICPAIM